MLYLYISEFLSQWNNVRSTNFKCMHALDKLNTHTLKFTNISSAFYCLSLKSHNQCMYRVKSHLVKCIQHTHISRDAWTENANIYILQLQSIDFCLCVCVSLFVVDGLKNNKNRNFIFCPLICFIRCMYVCDTSCVMLHYLSF